MKHMSELLDCLSYFSIVVSGCHYKVNLLKKALDWCLVNSLREFTHGRHGSKHDGTQKSIVLV